MINIRGCAYAILAGILSGVAASVFLISLHYLTAYRISHEYIVYGLPLAGLLIGWLYHEYGKEIQPGSNLIIDEIQAPRSVTPMRMSPAIFASTLLTHLFGGSAGREGTVVQMGASLSDQISRVFPVSPSERKMLLVAGAGSGFGAALGVPFAGVLFGMEFLPTQRLKIFAVVECAIASFIAYYVSRFLQAPHSHFERISQPFSISAVLWTLVASVLFAATSRGFLWTEHQIEKTFKKWISFPPLKPLVGGILLVILFKGFSLEAYEGLGLETLMRSFHENFPVSVFLIKLVLTALTLASGFKGGEFVPLIFMGATAGAFLTGVSGFSTPLLPALGCVALFAAASKTPFSCSIMAIELFGWEIAPYAIPCCFLSAFLSGDKSIYRKHIK